MGWDARARGYRAGDSDPGGRRRYSNWIFLLKRRSLQSYMPLLSDIINLFDILACVE